MKKILIFLISLFLAFGTLIPNRAVLAEGSCFCSTVSPSEFTNATDATAIGDSAKYDASCFPLQIPQCFSGTASVDAKYKECVPYTTPTECEANATSWRKAKDDAIQDKLKAGRTQRTELHNKGVIERLLPSCVFEAQVTGDCRHINVFIKVGIDIADYVLGVVGALALAVFVYGGVMMVISEGHSDRVEKGKEAVAAALIGLIVIFSAYILVKFFAGVVGVQPGFNLQ